MPVELGFYKSCPIRCATRVHFHTGYYQASPTKEYTEDSAGGDCDVLAKLCRDWEEAAQIQDKGKTRQVIVRIGETSVSLSIAQLLFIS